MLRLSGAALAIALLSPVVAPEPAEAQSERRSKQQVSRPAQPISAEAPLLSLVSLNQQRMFVYDANGFVVQTRVSSGRTGHETPKGIYSILEKKVDHTSNIYLDAKMPHMQRLTMTGIALHGGVIPGYAASGGCVRLPFDFARRFFSMTDLGQRVVIAPDVHAPVQLEHSLLFAALPSAAASAPERRAESTGDKARRIGSDVAETLLGVTSAHAATEPQAGAVRTQESAAEARRAERTRLADAVAAAEDRVSKGGEKQKAAQATLSEARTAAQSTATASSRAARAASKAEATLKTAERTLKRASSRIPKDTSKMRSDRLDALRQQEAAERERVAKAAEEVRVTGEAAKSAADAAEAAKQAVAEAQEAVKAARDEIKDAGVAEKDTKKALAAFDRQEQNRALPVSVFVSSATGTVSVRQGNEEVLTVEATIENPDVPLETFMFTAVKWKDESAQTELVWHATEVTDDENAMFASVSDEGSSRRNRQAQSAPLPPETDADKAARTLDRIKIPREVSDRIAEVVKPGSVLIVSSYDVSRSEMKYPGTDFIVQMPEVVAKITKPTPRPSPREEYYADEGGFFFFNGPSYSNSYYRDRDRDRDRRKRRTGGSKSFFW
ncbi:L,D-transpeptidase family protein [Hyphomicrobium sp. CS1GBMeth3]|uniref:L,D-transpeptidase family protein n=1 Tax=Hyphomicrobium sp. CS1GBMeth3 TaxID=1892845 RepID=UPI000930B273|nr:L,D-transpeptidase family protein [Hyphomicrobium sp. CS1GBMeth3]